MVVLTILGLVVLGYGVITLLSIKKTPDTRRRIEHGAKGALSVVLGLCFLFPQTMLSLVIDYRVATMDEAAKEQPAPSVPTAPLSREEQVQDTVLKLSFLHADHLGLKNYVPERARFLAAVRDLSIKCPDMEPSRIGDILYVGWQGLQQKGVPLTLLQVAEGVNKSIPADAAGQINCMESTAAWVTLAAGN